jgi:hypothetical protein
MKSGFGGKNEKEKASVARSGPGDSLAGAVRTEKCHTNPEEKPCGNSRKKAGE